MIYNPGELIHRVADQARPPAVYGRLASQDYDLEILLDDLVELGVWLSLELKKPGDAAGPVRARATPAHYPYLRFLGATPGFFEA